MGCGGSKSVEIKVTSSPGPFFDHEPDNNQSEVQFNVFDHTENNNELRGSCYNAKPRLRSAIRRADDTEIRPVISDDNNTEDLPTTELRHPPLDNVDQLLLGFETPFNGFDSNRTNSEASDWAKSVRSGRLTHSSLSTMRPDSITTDDSVITARDLNASFMTVSEDFATPANEDMTLLDLTTPHGDNMSEFEDSQYRILSNTPSRLTGSVEPRPFSVYAKNIGVIKEESEGGNTPRSLFSPDGGITCPPDTTQNGVSVTTQNGVPDTTQNGVPDTTQNGVPDTTLNCLQESLTKSSPEPISKISQNSISPPKDLPECPPQSLSIDPREASAKHSSKTFPKYSPDEVLHHNQKTGWSEWGIYKGMVYDTSKIIHTFTPIYNDRSKIKNDTKTNKQELSVQDDDSDSSDGDYYESDNAVKSLNELYPKNILNPTSSLSRAIKILINLGVELNTINQNLNECAIGEVVFVFSKQYWDSFRKDVDTVLDDLIRADLKDELSQNVRDVLEQLQRWLAKYRYQNPEPSHTQPGDPNAGQFLLPDGIQDHPERLRQWVESWEKFDLEIPDSGSWHMYEIEEIDLGDPLEIFIASLRSHVDLENPPIIKVDGEAAWEVLQPSLFADDVMTYEQRETEESRRYRTDLYDPRRMERRRKRLLTYFIRRYELHERNVIHFLQWSHAMEDGERRFQLLCNTS